MAVKGDEIGLFWEDPVNQRNVLNLALPATPETGWVMPTEFPDLRNAGMLAIDIETCDPDLRTKGPGGRRGAYIVGVAVGAENGYRAYFPIAHDLGNNLDKEKVFEWLREQLGREGQPKVGANLLYDLEFLSLAGVEVAGPFYDVQIAEPLIDETQRSYSLDNLARKYLGEGKVEGVLEGWLKKAFGGDQGNWKSNIYRAPAEVAGAYAEGDVDLPLRIFVKQIKILEKMGLLELFRLESRLIPLLLRMRLRGVPVDIQKAEIASRKMEQDFKEELKQIREKTGVNIDIWNAASLKKAYDNVALPYGLTPTGKPSFTKKSFEQNSHWLPQAILKARTLHKLNGTFIKGYILDGNIDGRLYGQFHQLRSDAGGTVSGRFSSSHPNLQNIPSRDPIYGKMIRGLFVPEEGCQWYKFDWSQIEYRIIVHYASLLKLDGVDLPVKMYREDRNTDFHQALADMTGLSRVDAKNLNFGLAYGQGIGLMQENLGVSREEAEQILTSYHSKAPFIRQLITLIQERINRKGYVRTILGRHRRFNKWEDREGNLYDGPAPGRQRAFTYAGLNAVIQGSAADVMKKAMLDCVPVFEQIGAPHLTVHDELDGSFLPEQAEALKEIHHRMENCVKLNVPLVADGETGGSWAC